MFPLALQDRWIRRSPWVTAVLAVVMVAGSNLLVRRPALEQADALDAQIDSVRKSLTEADAAIADLPRLREEASKLKTKLESAPRIPHNQDLAQFTRDVTTFAEETALGKFTVQPGVPARGELVSQIPVSLSFEGDFLASCEFLRRAETLPRLTSMRTMTIHATDPVAGKVEVQLSLSLYFADVH